MNRENRMKRKERRTPGTAPSRPAAQRAPRSDPPSPQTAATSSVSSADEALPLAQWLDLQCANAATDDIAVAVNRWRHAVQVDRPRWLSDHADLSKLQVEPNGEWSIGDQGDACWRRPGDANGAGSDEPPPAYSAALILLGMQLAAADPDAWSQREVVSASWLTHLLSHPEAFSQEADATLARMLWQWNEFALDDIPSLGQLAQKLDDWLGVPAPPPEPEPEPEPEPKFELVPKPEPALAPDPEPGPESEQKQPPTGPPPEPGKPSPLPDPVEPSPEPIEEVEPLNVAALLDAADEEILAEYDLVQIRQAELTAAERQRFADWTREHLRDTAAIGFSPSVRLSRRGDAIYRATWSSQTRDRVFTDKLIVGVCRETPGSDTPPEEAAIWKRGLEAPLPNYLDLHTDDDWDQWCVAVWAVYDLDESDALRIYSRPIISRFIRVPVEEPENTKSLFGKLKRAFRKGTE